MIAPGVQALLPVLLLFPRQSGEQEQNPVPSIPLVEITGTDSTLRGLRIDFEPSPLKFFLIGENGRIESVRNTSGTKIDVIKEVSVDEVPAESLAYGLTHDNRLVRAYCKSLLEQRTSVPTLLVRSMLKQSEEHVLVPLLRILTTKPDPGVAKEVRALTASESESVRETALEAYAALNRRDLFDLCERMLVRDHSVRVRHEAISQLGMLGEIEAVDVLLEVLVHCDERNLRVRIFHSLTRITGQRFGRNEKHWLNWWNNHRDELLP